MQKFLTLTTLLLISLIYLGFNNNTGETYYYYQYNKKVPLLIEENSLIAKFILGTDKEKAENFLTYRRARKQNIPQNVSGHYHQISCISAY